MTIEIDWIGGNCPVQAEGTVDGVPFYFRARGEHWSMSIGVEDALRDIGWYYEEPYGDEQFAAGWMSEEEALAFIHQAAEQWRNGDEDDGQPDEAQEWHDFDPEA